MLRSVVLLLCCCVSSTQHHYYELQSQWKSKGVLFYSNNIGGCRETVPLLLRRNGDTAIEIKRFCEACTGGEIDDPRIHPCVHQIEMYLILRVPDMCGNVERDGCYQESTLSFLRNAISSPGPTLVSKVKNACNDVYSCILDLIRRVWVYLIIYGDNDFLKPFAEKYILELETDRSILTKDDFDLDTLLFSSMLPLHSKRRLLIRHENQNVDVVFDRKMHSPMTLIRKLGKHSKNKVDASYILKNIFPRLYELLDKEAIRDNQQDQRNIESQDNTHIDDDDDEPRDTIMRARDSEKFQKYLERIQHSTSCERVFVWNGHVAGLGSQINVLVNSFLSSIFHERTFIGSVAYTQYVNPKRCRTVSIDGCLIEPLSSCKIEDMLSKTLAKQWLEEKRTPELRDRVYAELQVMFPSIAVDSYSCHAVSDFKRIAKRAGLSKVYGEHWFYMEAFRFIYKPVSIVTQTVIKLEQMMGIVRGKLPIVGVHWRGGDKTSSYRTSNHTMEEYVVAVRERALVLGAKTVFLSSNVEIDTQIKFVNLIEKDNSGIRVVDVPFNLSKTLDSADKQALHLELNYDDDEWVVEKHVLDGAQFDEGLLLMATLELFAMCDDFVGSLGSNMARITYQIKETRQTQCLLDLVKASGKYVSTFEMTGVVNRVMNVFWKSQPRFYDMDGNSFYTCGDNEDERSLSYEREQIKRRQKQANGDY